MQERIARVVCATQLLVPLWCWRLLWGSLREMLALPMGRKQVRSRLLMCLLGQSTWRVLKWVLGRGVALMFLVG
jgi:hypothetical protein